MPHRLRVTRTQWPVGQGTFSTGWVSFADSRASSEDGFHYVYDCGSQSSELITEAVGEYAAITSRVDALFVSHFDKDHVNGIDALTSRMEVDTVYLPYINDDAILFDVLKAMSRG
jgi:glyoxylase-like metal-dependent hydrolase (beta-lactamase superfamily II)